MTRRRNSDVVSDIDKIYGSVSGAQFAVATVIESPWVEPGAIFLAPFGLSFGGGPTQASVIVHPYNRYGERAGKHEFMTNPLWTRHMVGVQEAGRNRRKRSK